MFVIQLNVINNRSNMICLHLIPKNWLPSLNIVYCTAHNSFLIIKQNAPTQTLQEREKTNDKNLNCIPQRGVTIRLNRKSRSKCIWLLGE